MTQETYRINGQVTDQQTKDGVAGARVEAWDADLVFDDLVGSVTTDEQGLFLIEFDESYFAEIFFDRRPDLYFRVYIDDSLVLDTRDHCLWNMKSKSKTVELVVESDRTNLPPGDENGPVIPSIKLDDLSSVLKLSAQAKRKLKDKNLSLDQIGETALTALVDEKIINETEKKEIQITVGLVHLSGENLGLVKELKGSVQDSTIELVGWGKADWLQFLKKKRIKLPEDEVSLDSYADNLRDVVERSFPSEYFLHRVVNKDNGDKVAGPLQTIAPLFTNNRTVVSAGPDESLEYEWKGITAAKRKKIEAGLAELTPLVNTYRSLGVAEIINNPKLKIEQKLVALEKRLTSLNTFYSNNPGINLEFADFSTSGADKKDSWNWKGVKAADKPYINKQMAASQRVFILGSNYETGELLMQKGYDSAGAITSKTENDFLEDTGLGWQRGKEVYARAGKLAASAAHYYEAIRDITRGPFLDIAKNNQQNSLVNDLKEIDGYEELFGNQDFCDCEHCKSILSPAAYFVDLMYFVHEHVSKKTFPPSQVDHSLYLKRRRPDLWTLKLSCHNTSTEIPYLQVVNEVLEKYLEQEIPTSDVYETLRTADWSCSQPFNLALEETRLFLPHFDLTLAEIYKALKQPVEEQLRERLRLSVEEMGIVATPDPAGAQKRFGNIPLANFDVQEFIRLADISRPQLDDLLATKFAPSIAEVKVKMVKQGTDIQQYHEELTGLTGARLDLIHRFLRLWKKTDWTLREFDLLLYSMKSAGLISKLETLDGGGKPKFLKLAQVCSIQEKIGCSAEEMATVLYRFSLDSIADDQEPLYYRVFDLKKIFGVENVIDIIDTTTTILPADKADDKITPLILAGLGISESELEALFGLLGIDISIDQTVDIGLLSTLYRHALVARGLKLGVEDFVNLHTLVSGGGAITGLSQIELLGEAVDLRKASTFNISQLMLIISGTESADLQYSNDIHAASAAVSEIQKSAEADKKEKKVLLQSYLQKSFNLTTEQLNEDFLQHLVPYDLEGAEIVKALDATFTDNVVDNPADLDGLVDLLQGIERYVLLFDKAKLDAEMISFLVDNPDVFGIGDFQNLNFTQVFNIVGYQALFENKEEQRPALFQALRNIENNGGFSSADNEVFAEAWQQPESLISSLTNALSAPMPTMAAIEYLQNILAICIKLGLQGDALLKLKSSDNQGLLAARNVVVGAFASTYPDEEIRNEKMEAYVGKLNTLKRDALCDYIISRNDMYKFKDRNDLYNFFLLDVEMSGCFRTSYLVAAITSLQLYIHRCLMNLEQSDTSLNPAIVDIKVAPGLIPGDEWTWRKNYRVWEANRKVFLYPENYIDPTLRDNKTEIFKELEDELLQQKISQDSAEAAYKKYLAQFSELTRLRYAGGYYHQVSQGFGFFDLDMKMKGSDAKAQAGKKAFYFINAIGLETDSKESLFYLFARTNVHPYRYYYRTYNHYKKVWTSWETIDLGIEAAEISTIIFQGKLYIYWKEVQSKEVNKVVNGTSEADGFVFKVYVKYSYLDGNGKWSAPQRLYIGHTHVDEETVFRRVWKGEYPSDKIREKTHDSTVEKFQELVFRKPYAVSVDDIKQPIALQHIWSHNKTVSQVEYTVSNISIEYCSLLRFDVPGHTFAVTNNDFELAKATIAASVTILSTGQKAEIEAELSLQNGSSGYVSFDFVGLGFAFPAPVVSSSYVNTPIKTNTTKVSLSRNNVTNLRNDDMLTQASDINTVPALKDEYNLAFSENHNNGYYVESGKESLSKHFVVQMGVDISRLFIKEGNGLGHALLSTILTDELGDILFAKGLEQFLSLTTQNLTDDAGQQFDFDGAYGVYYWEMFFHIPFLIADHLNANQKFKEAKWWYERIFNPTADEKPDDVKKTDHNWQFREFRNLDIQKLKDILIDESAIEAYKKDPFNPHAIARLRLSAYQKTIVMHYIDNLLDWGDFLFTQDTRESINEAEMLYQLAFDILGKRPIKVGKCPPDDDDTVAYANIEPHIGKGSEFLIQLENYSLVQKGTYGYAKELTKAWKAFDAMSIKKKASQKSFAEIAKKSSFHNTPEMMMKVVGQMATATGFQATSDVHAARVKSYKKVAAKKNAAREKNSKWKDADRYLFGKDSDHLKTTPNRRMPAYELVKHYSTVFCVPANSDLMKYWDRVEDRLFKIRHCMNIKGIRRSLSLFQPPIDPMMLVRARAAGLSLEDIAALVGGMGDLPVYRFTFLIEKAKQFTQTLQSFGSELLSALEKKDGEELVMLRSVHEKNILKMTRNVKRKQLQESQNQYKGTEAALTNVQNRVDYFQGLIDTGLTPWELTEQVSKWTASGIRISESVLGFLSSVFGFLPQVGSPFAMKYGGQELKNGTGRLADATGTLAAIADNIAILAGLEASHQRREQDWRQQLKLAQQEYKQTDFQLLAADIRQQIAEKDLEIHEKNIEQSDELYDFYKGKFTNLGLYNYLASTLNRLYRNAYNIAYDLAKQAETAYRFETFDSEVSVQADNWQFERAGLLAGENLMLQLQELEKKFLDGNERRPEITQTFSLSMLSPIQLLNLRQTGSCTFTIPEIAFEILYPGQYRRVIKSVHITIPCIAGQYTNISARLTLTKGMIELEDKAPLEELLVAKNTSITSSSANNDAGVFDLNFRDERYLPFEGGGAVDSEWSLELPSKLRSFDYDTISDVLLHISYTALDGNREDAENDLAAALIDYTTNPGAFRLLSLKHDFPDSFHRLLNPPSGESQTAQFSVEKNHFPYLLHDKSLSLLEVKVYLKPKKGLSVGTPAPMKVNVSNNVSWTADEDIAMPGSAGAKDKIKGGTVNVTGDPVKIWEVDAGVSGLDKAKIEDILVLLEYKIS